MKKANLIKSDDYYSLLQLYKLNVFKWIKSYDTLKRWVKRDLDKDNKIFRTIRYGQGKGTRYLIKGSVILTLIKDVETGKIFDGK